MTLIIAGKVYVDPADRDEFIEGHRTIVEQARKYPGCLDVAISPDPVDAGRVNLFEYWESKEILAAWRAIAPRPTTSIAIRVGEALKHEVSHSGLPFD
ncbi:putative quinol monooxygenase [Amycolatopsis sp. H20-H5]|uniref:putative quinol monooxygenase n=1 Tax=Amycolatopsis sp. H20-H5 TaxID=3046309 RepID=UPI002DBC2919|nr:antibiotic biosynthesis monooxygenase [Amycolatopsis sp. H20-H5]MEC3976853.1 antibiotic biosynthesis monooxygenase [Amycolatopsis sp. H20-H5]